MEKEQPKIVLKKCEVCQKVVKSVLFKKGDLYDDYICLDDIETQDFHVFKVKTSRLVSIETIESAFGPAATTMLSYSLMHMSASHQGSHTPPPEPTGTEGEPIANVDDITDQDVGSHFVTADSANGTMFDGDSIDVDGDLFSYISDFLSNLG